MAPPFVNRDEVRAKAGTTDTAIRSFDTDLRSRLSYIDPSSNQLGDAIDATDANASEKIYLSTQFAFNADDVALSLKNSVGKDDATLAKEQAFYTAWLKFFVRWQLFYRRIQSFDLLGPSPMTVWDSIDQYNRELDAWQQKAKTDFQISPTAPEPPATPTGLEIPWGKIIFAAAAVAVIVKGPDILKGLTKRS